MIRTFFLKDIFLPIIRKGIKGGHTGSSETNWEVLNIPSKSGQWPNLKQDAGHRETQVQEEKPEVWWLDGKLGGGRSQ